MLLFRRGHLIAASALVSVFVVLAPSVSALQGDKKPGAKMEQAQRQEAQALVALVDDFANGKPPAASPPALTWEQQHFIKGLADKTYVPFTVAAPPGSFTGPVGVYLRVVAKGSPAVAPPPADKDDKDKKDKKSGAAPPSPYAFEDLFFTDAVPPATDGQPQRIRRAFAVAPGDYDVYVAVKERTPAGASGAQTGAAPPKAAVIKQSVTAPNFASGELTTSSVIVAQSVDVLQTPLSQDTQADNPYTFGQMKIVPAVDPKFNKSGQLTVIMWIYGAKEDATTKKPDVNMEFKFYQKAADKETYFNKTQPQALNAQTLPPQFDLAAGHQLLGTLELPLASFPPGDYRLEIEVQDKVANQKLTRDVAFTVTG
jgi:hypothetical protein